MHRARWFRSAIFGGGMLSASFLLAQGVEIDVPGTTVRVGPDKGATAEVEAQGGDIRVGGQRPAAPAGPKNYWVGLLGGDVSQELRMHLRLDGVGVIVQQVMPGSPAAAAGIEKHDILLSADGAPIGSMADLVTVVRAAGPKDRPIALELIRRGEPITLDVTPVERPAQRAPVGVKERFGNDPFGNNPFGRLPFGGDGFGAQQFNFRMFGPGGLAIQAGKGVSVSVQSLNGQTRVEARQGDQIWNFDPNDQQELAKLPPDVRQAVDGLLNNGALNIGVELGDAIAEMEELFEGRANARGLGRGFFGRRRERNNPIPPNAAQPLDEAPAFDPEDQAAPSGPVEIDIPADNE